MTNPYRPGPYMPPGFRPLNPNATMTQAQQQAFLGALNKMNQQQKGASSNTQYPYGELVGLGARLGHLTLDLGEWGVKKISDWLEAMGECEEGFQYVGEDEEGNKVCVKCPDNSIFQGFDDNGEAICIDERVLARKHAYYEEQGKVPVEDCPADTIEVGVYDDGSKACVKCPDNSTFEGLDPSTGEPICVTDGGSLESGDSVLADTSVQDNPCRDGMVLYDYDSAGNPICTPPYGECPEGMIQVSQKGDRILCDWPENQQGTPPPPPRKKATQKPKTYKKEFTPEKIPANTAPLPRGFVPISSGAIPDVKIDRYPNLEERRGFEPSIALDYLGPTRPKKHIAEEDKAYIKLGMEYNPDETEAYLKRLQGDLR